MICTSVVPCLSSGLAKNNKTMSVFVLFSWLFGHFERMAFFEKKRGGGGGGANLTPKQSNSMF